jgi:hypothetical protein
MLLERNSPLAELAPAFRSGAVQVLFIFAVIGGAERGGWRGGGRAGAVGALGGPGAVGALDVVMRRMLWALDVVDAVMWRVQWEGARCGGCDDAASAVERWAWRARGGSDRCGGCGERDRRGWQAAAEPGRATGPREVRPR